MLRFVLESVALFLAPTLIYIAYVWLMRGDDKSRPLLSEAPLIWLFAAGAIITVAIMAMFAQTEGGKPGQTYFPPTVKDGKVVPGHFK